MISIADLDLSHQTIGLAPYEVDRQETVAQIRAAHFDVLGQDESALELACSNPPIQVLARFVIVLFAADGKLAILDSDLELLAREPRHRKRYAQELCAIALDGQSFNIVRWVAVAPFACTLDEPLQVLEAEQ